MSAIRNGRDSPFATALACAREGIPPIHYMIALAGGALVAIAWSLNSVADSLPLLYLGAALGGIGAGSFLGVAGWLKIAMVGASS